MLPPPLVPQISMPPPYPPNFMVSLLKKKSTQKLGLKNAKKTNKQKAHNIQTDTHTHHGFHFVLSNYSWA